MTGRLLEQLRHWLDVVATACGLDSASDASVAGLAAVALAGATLVFAAYRAVTATLWPGETDPRHVKHRMLRDEVDDDAG